MKLIFIRHAEPDYEHDTITEKGWREAELLSDRISKLDVKQFYCSPLGRAKDTASVTLKKMQREAITYDWLGEFPAVIKDPDGLSKGCAWDLLPHFWTNESTLYDKDNWFNQPLMKEGKADIYNKAVIDGFNALLAEHGYKRHGRYYITDEGNTDTLVFFCHLGVQLVILSHLLGIAAPVLWQGFFIAPTAVTTVASEERVKGEVYFRCKGLGDISHLYVAGEPISNSGSFQEIYK